MTPPRPAAPSHPPSRPPFDVPRLTESLLDLGFADVRVVDRTGSTNSDLVAAAGEGAPDLTVLLAEEQVAGRGRLGRTWSAPARSQLIVSVLVRPAVAPERLGTLPLVTGVALAEAVRGLGVDATLKWPNDLMVGDRKLAGVLVEAVQLTPRPAVVVGFGLNVDLREDELPVPHATSLVLERARAGGEAAGDAAGDAAAGDAAGVDRQAFAVEVLRRVVDCQRRWRTGDATVDDAYRRLCATLGSEVTVTLPGDREVRGTALRVTPTGELVVRPADPDPADPAPAATTHSTAPAAEITVSAGDVTHLRPAAGGPDGGGAGAQAR
ncbi:biotin--[acetyl-CoA-carboxylase] ligase [Corynebacterium bovis]|uniref:biotin--[acetyl-CoA-carboxylase] ligase n=1 Tax=Corynebacterium bovis TaxID=36808 RepID=UPI0024488B38|nr:biotin--[acetyl-CoA-carboxylase] ligase [Corynebacterium bovis]MDH2455546.1 biotin--[acetyl-CoA-carboxylase] ligase [Corynebacterium bovis]